MLVDSPFLFTRRHKASGNDPGRPLLPQAVIHLVLTFPFVTAREPMKLAERVSFGLCRIGEYDMANKLKIDKIDQKILSLLQNNARTPLKHLASKVFLSSPAVSSRIERLEKRGIIRGYHAAIDSSALEYHIQAFVNLALNPKEKENFFTYIEPCPNVIECHCITGHCSMLMKVLFKTTDDLDIFVNHLQHYGVTETQIIFSTPIEPRGILSMYTDADDTKESAIS